MTRTLKLFVLPAVVWMTAVALGVGLWRWNAAGDLAHLSRRWWVGTLMMGFFPVWVTLGALLWSRLHPRTGIKLAADTRRHNEITLLGAVALAVGVQLWVGGIMLGVIPKGEVGVRLVEALTGVFIMVAANFGAKTSPPTGELAPDPAVWARGMLRIGWAGVISGLVIVIAAITVAIDQMVWIILGASGAQAAFAVWQARAMHRKPTLKNHSA